MLWSVLVASLRLMKLDESKELPVVPPVNVAARHRAATSVAAAIKSGGLIQGDIGFNQILYPSEKDVRRLISWAVSNLPQAGDTASDGIGAGGATTPAIALLRGMAVWMGSSGGASGVNNSAGTTSGTSKIMKPATSPLAPYSLFALEKALAVAAPVRGNPSDKVTRARRARDSVLAALRYDAGASASSPSAAGASLVWGDSACVLASSSSSSLSASGVGQPPQLPTWNDWLLSRGPHPLGGGSTSLSFAGTSLGTHSTAFNRRAAFAIIVTKATGRGSSLPTATTVATPDTAFTRTKTEDELAREREEVLAELASRLEIAMRAAESARAARAALALTLPILQSQLAGEVERAAEVDASLRARTDALASLPNADSELTRLGAELAAAIGRLRELGGAWSSARAPLDAEIAALEATAAAEAQESLAAAASIASARAAMGELAAAAAAKDEALVRAQTELARVMGGAAASSGGDGGDAAPMSRALYARIVLDIQRGIRKQSQEIARIVADVRRVQIEAAAVADGLRRIASVATEQMEAAAVSHSKDPNYRAALRQLLALQEAFSALIAAAAAAGAAENAARDIDNRIDQMLARNDRAALQSIEKDLSAIKAENAALLAQTKVV